MHHEVILLFRTIEDKYLNLVIDQFNALAQ
jgi:hypothetical protein